MKGEEDVEKVIIKRNPLGDSRTAERVPTYREFEKANSDHAIDVSNMMYAVSNVVRESGRNHDYTKLSEKEAGLFYRELCDAIEGKMKFEEGRWYEMHCNTERHHLNQHCPEDVNLVDVIEMICDCVCAGMARSTRIYPVEIRSEVLQLAVCNTVRMCIDAVEIEEGTK